MPLSYQFGVVGTRQIPVPTGVSMRLPGYRAYGTWFCTTDAKWRHPGRVSNTNKNMNLNRYAKIFAKFAALDRRTDPMPVNIRAGFRQRIFVPINELR